MAELQIYPASPYISPVEAAVSSLIYQMSIYTVSRLVRRGFTLGELSLATGAGISLVLEFWRLSSARVSSVIVQRLYTLSYFHGSSFMLSMEEYQRRSECLHLYYLFSTS